MDNDSAVRAELADRRDAGAALRRGLGIHAAAGSVPEAVLQDAEDEFSWGSIWARPGLSERTKSALALAMTSALSQKEGVAETCRIAVQAGWSVREIAEILLFVQCYAGLYAAREAARTVAGVLGDAGLLPEAGPSASAAPKSAPLGAYGQPMATELARFGLQVRREVFGTDDVDRSLERTLSNPFLSMFFDTTHEYCFGKIWASEVLPRQTRSMLSLAITAVRGLSGAVRRHARSAIEGGLTEEELGEVFLLVYVYGGVYCANASFFAADEVLSEMVKEGRR